ncbi:hypothetical protein THRCLA_00994 [Thraustotheca clavata]|uniref:Nucleotide-diphospho-sugar transferase domain-containing protein n=1 Tax=Thraustotheca clavata TaxID=74557 RepID=A0A1W0A9J6_9STRA|nr:hypothetical protein THRCLA_00994 [Thraustotheca clavata]
MEATPTDEYTTLMNLALTTGVRGYRNLYPLYQKHFGLDQLSIQDKHCINQVICSLRAHDAEIERNTTIQSNTNVAVFTAYTTDYSVGHTCAHINQLYAQRHGYPFYCDVLPYKEMMTAIAPRNFCGWYKVAMIKRFFEDMEALKAQNIGYLMWIDADAVVIDHSIAAQSLIVQAQHRDLIISEDINPCCMINTGVMLIKLSEWSRDLWNEVWTMRRYFDVFYYEQSALMRCLKKREEGLVNVRPFHSFVPGGPQGLKLFPHVAVTPHLELNSNRCSGMGVDIADSSKRIDTRYSNEEQKDEMARYIFHCAGRCDKALTLKAVLEAKCFDISTLELKSLKLERYNID